MTHVEMVRTRAPWSEDQVACLRAFQTDGWNHAFTCPNRTEGKHEYRCFEHPTVGIGPMELGLLAPTVQGWICRDCDYTQDWAYDFMLTWRTPWGRCKHCLDGTEEGDDPKPDLCWACSVAGRM